MYLIEKLYHILNTSRRVNKPVNNITSAAGRSDGLPEGRTEPKKQSNPEGSTEKNPKVKKKLHDEADKGTLTKKHPVKGKQ